MKRISSIAASISVAIACSLSPLAWSACAPTGVQLQILGSGGPGPAGGRASAGYLLWINGQSRIMVDAGSGTKDQFHQAGANLAELSLIALSHLHPDHAAELPAILWPAGANLAVSGPGAAGVFPAVDDFLDSLFGAGGAFAILGDRVQLTPVTLDTGSPAAQNVWSDAGIVVRARAVPHGDVPTLAYRFDFGDTSIAFTSDQTGSDASFPDFIRDVDFLVIHMAVAENVAGVGAQLHAKPSVWGQMATAAQAGHVVVSHISSVTAAALEADLAILRANYTGTVTVAEDLLCVGLDRAAIR
ncbi:MAG: MBL fold metallo-hydrolase [Pseudohongiellaceae bacterium]